jgi:hypothetical protein
MRKHTTAAAIMAAGIGLTGCVTGSQIVVGDNNAKMDNHPIGLLKHPPAKSIHHSKADQAALDKLIREQTTGSGK